MQTRFSTIAVMEGIVRLSCEMLFTGTEMASAPSSSYMQARTTFEKSVELEPDTIWSAPSEKVRTEPNR